MKLFKRSSHDLSKGQAQTAEKIADQILHGQRRAADYLNGKTAGLSPWVWRVLLFVFCTGFGGYCLYLLMQVFN